MRLCMRNFASAIATLSKKGSAERRLLDQALLVVKVPPFIWHIPLMYLNPRRPTLISMEMADYLFVGRSCVRPIVVGGEIEDIPDVVAMSRLDLDKSHSAHFYRLLKFDVPMKPWFPSRRLPIEELDKSIPMPKGNPIPFWRGAREELQAEMEKIEKKKEAEVRRQARAEGAAPKPKAKSKAKATAKRTNSSRPSQKAPQASPIFGFDGRAATTGPRGER